MSDVVRLGSPLDWNIGLPGGANHNPKRIEETGKQFEALLLGQMLKSMREADGSAGWLGTGEDTAGTPMGEFAEQQLAQMFSAQGGLGLANVISKGLAQKVHETETSSTASATPAK
jgi:Rod binding domain-containing protein